MKRTNPYKISFLVLLVLVLAACSTTKNTWVTRTYHNVTSRYNGYYYARESMKEAQLKISKTYVDDYSQLLPLYRLPNTPETKGCFADYEKAIKKSSGVIEHHAIVKKGTNPPQEIPGAVKWIDDNYLIIGQAYYYKGEYLAALDIFDYIIQKYGDFPIRNDAILWKARTQIQMNAYTDAENLLDMVAGQKGADQDLTDDIKIAYADLYMHRGNYALAIKNLEEGIELTKSKKDRARYLFVLAQMYEKTGKDKKAYETYAKVIDLNPAYDMLFNAKLCRARLSASDPAKRTESKKELQKMLEDSKNNEYQDQIYYTLAQLEMGAKNRASAINYYRLSVRMSQANNKQKSLSYLALGDLYFADTDYKNAQAYYDSTMLFLPKDYPDYNAISEKQKSLNNLVRYINTVSDEDSLQMVVKKYGGDTTTLYPYIDKLIKKAQEDEKKKKELLEQQMSGGGGTGPNNQNNNPFNSGNQAVQFYFYNPSTVSFGINEFTRKWGGGRKLEDNWRRANKESFIEVENGGDNEDDSGKVAGTQKGNNDKFSRNYYIKNLPMTPEMLAKSDEKIADALFNLGSLYKEQMFNNAKASEAFEMLCQRYPKHKYALPSHFQLYRIYSTTGNTAKADEHKNYICNNFPDGEYCALIKNPNHEVDVMRSRREASAYYDSTYMIYLRRDYAQVISRCNYADSSFGTKNDHAAKFAYLRAVSLGKTQGTKAMESELTRLVANYAKDPIRPQAQALLDAIRKQNGGTVEVPVQDTATKGPAYVVNENTEYQYMIVVETGKGDINKFRIALADFNSQMFSSSNLSISSIVLDNKRQCIMVKKFENKAKAMSYYDLMKGHPEIFANLQQGSYQVVAISTENFAMFIKDKNVNFYKAFFEKNILPKK